MFIENRSIQVCCGQRSGPDRLNASTWSHVSTTFLECATGNLQKAQLSRFVLFIICLFFNIVHVSPGPISLGLWTNNKLIKYNCVFVRLFSRAGLFAGAESQKNGIYLILGKSSFNHSCCSKKMIQSPAMKLLKGL